MRIHIKNIFQRFRLTIRRKLAIIFTLLILFISAFIFFYFPLKLEQEALAPIADKAWSLSRMTAFSMGSSLMFKDKRDMYAVIESIKKNQDLAYLIIQDRQGENFFTFNLSEAEQADYRFRLSQGPFSPDRTIYRTMSPIQQGGSEIGRLFLGMSLENLRYQVRRNRKTAAQVSAAVFILGLLVVFFISAVLTRPLKRMVRTINEIAGGDLTRRIDLSANDEAGDLARSFNVMVGNLESASREMLELNKTLEVRIADRTAELQLEINERKQAQNILAEEKERLAVTLASIGEGVIATDTKGKVTMINRVAEKLTGWSLRDSLGRPIADIFNIFDKDAPDMRKNPVKTVLETSKIVEVAGETILVDKSGGEAVISANTAPIYDRTSRLIGTVLVFRDITEAKKIEKELFKMQKLESVELLAGGIAHDFNNIMTAIMGNIDLIKLQSNPEGPTYEKLKAADSAVKRAQALTRQLLTFSKERVPLKTLTSISELLQETVNFTLSGSNVEARVSISPNLEAVECDADQISLVFNNILINAQQAMPDGGVVEIKAGNLKITDRDGRSFKPGRYVEIIIRDNGIGIGEDELPKIFDPFFTDKPRGSGLGLATSYSIIKKHNGDILVESEKGKGTVFYIYLPSGQGQLQTKDKTKSSIPRGEGRILLMDDEEIVLETGGKILKFLGYETEFAYDGVEAVELFRESRDFGKPFRAVIMDLTIPGGMGGKEAVKRILEIDPEAKVIASSGYTVAHIVSDSDSPGFSGFLNKPYLVEEMGSLLKTILSPGPSPDPQ